MTARLKFTPSTRTVAHLEARGYVVGQCGDYWRGPCRVDMHRCWDFVAVGASGDVKFVQATSATNVAARVKKCLAEPTTAALVARGVSCEVWGWDHRAEPRIERLSA